MADGEHDCVDSSWRSQYFLAVEKLRKAEEDMEDMLEAHEGLEHEYENERKEQDRQLDELRKRVAELAEVRERYQQNLASNNTLIGQLQAGAEELQNQNGRLRTQLVHCDLANEDLERAHRIAEDDKKNLEREYEQLIIENAEKESRIDSLEDSSNRLEVQVKDLELELTIAREDTPAEAGTSQVSVRPTTPSSSVTAVSSDKAESISVPSVAIYTMIKIKPRLSGLSNVNKPAAIPKTRFLSGVRAGVKKVFKPMGGPTKGSKQAIFSDTGRGSPFVLNDVNTVASRPVSLMTIHTKNQNNLDEELNAAASDGSEGDENVFVHSPVHALPAHVRQRTLSGLSSTIRSRPSISAATPRRWSAEIDYSTDPSMDLSFAALANLSLSTDDDIGDLSMAVSDIGEI